MRWCWDSGQRSDHPCGGVYYLPVGASFGDGVNPLPRVSTVLVGAWCGRVSLSDSWISVTIAGTSGLQVEGQGQVGVDSGFDPWLGCPG